MGKRTIKAQEVLRDIRAGMSNAELMQKYQISENGLESLFRKLVEARLLRLSEFGQRASRPPGTLEMQDAFPPSPPSPQVAIHGGIGPIGSSQAPEQSERSRQNQVGRAKPGKAAVETKAEDVEQVERSIPSQGAPKGFLLRSMAVCTLTVYTLLSILRRAGRLIRKKSRDTVALPQSEPALQPTPDVPPQEPMEPSKGRREYKDESAAARPKPRLRFLHKMKAMPAVLAGFVISLLTGKFLLKILIYLAVAILFVVSLSVIINPGELKMVREIQSLQRVDPVPRARALEAEGELCQALDYLSHFMEYDYVQKEADALALYEALKKKRDSLTFRGTDVVKGMIYGKGACPEATITATVSDFLLIGDVRDLTWGLVNKYYYKEDADDFTTALAGVGVLLWGATVVSIPTAPITVGTPTAGFVAGKASVVLLKFGNKMGKIPKSLKASILKVLQETRETKNLKHFRPIADSIYQLSKAPGVRIKDAMTLLSRCNHINDLEKMGKAAAVYGKKTGKFVELAGDRSLTIFTKFGHSRQITVALDSAIMYGPKGIIVLEKAGPDKFMKYLKLTKFSVRGIRSWHEGHLSEAARTVLLYAVYGLKQLFWHFPSWAQFSIMLVTGLITIGIPMRGGYRAWRWFSARA